MFSPKIRFQILGWVKKQFDYQILLNLKTWAQAFEYNGQRALVLDTGPDNADSDGTPESVPRRVTVELMRSGQRMSLRRDKLRFVQTETDSEVRRGVSAGWWLGWVL